MTGDPIDDATRAIDYVLDRLGPPPARDPSTETWRETVGLSTSAPLRQTQRDLAASQADLSHVERQLADAERELHELTRLLLEAREQLVELERTRSWAVADRTVGPCAACSRPIVRGQAFQPLADAKGYFAHVFCDLPQEN